MELSKNMKICFVSMFILMLTLVLAGNIDVISFEDSSSGEGINGVRYLLYKCPNEVCESVDSLVFDLNSGSNDFVTYEYPSIDYSYYGAYMYKECYLPYQDSYWNSGSGETYPWTYSLEKKASCRAPIDSFSVTNDNYVNEPLVINMLSSLDAETSSAFRDSGIYPRFLPSGFDDYYSAETSVTLEIVDSSGDVIYTDIVDLNIFMDSSEEVEFSWMPTVEGDYTARVTSKVTDCQCQSDIEAFSEKEFVVWPARPSNACYSVLNNLEATPEVPIAGDLVTVVFDKISNYAANDFSKTPIPTRVVYEIFQDGDTVYTDNLLIGANADSFNPEDVSFTWTPVLGGSYNIRVTGVAESALCNSLTNPEEVLVLDYYALVPPEESYTVTFVVSDGSSFLEGADVDFGIQSGDTDSVGSVMFITNEGVYDWGVVLSGYVGENGSVDVSGNTTVSVDLTALAAPACGDGNLDVGETCDDGNIVNGDGCSDVCIIEVEDEDEDEDSHHHSSGGNKVKFMDLRDVYDSGEGSPVSISEAVVLGDDLSEDEGIWGMVLLIGSLLFLFLLLVIFWKNL